TTYLTTTEYLGWTWWTLEAVYSLCVSLLSTPSTKAAPRPSYQSTPAFSFLHESVIEFFRFAATLYLLSNSLPQSIL
ncbi:MAG TPA: hypothetical protein PLE92_08200, partial [Lentisphaeria bacterium]|nr:hypothetical protein [Lentisphaeria bacterium]